MSNVLINHVMNYILINVLNVNYIVNYVLINTLNVNHVLIQSHSVTHCCITVISVRMVHSIFKELKNVQ